jgi:hypothetical protein
MYYYDSDNLATLQKMFYAPESLSLPTKKLTVVAQGMDFSAFAGKYNPGYDGLFFEDLRIYNKYLTQEEVYISRHQKILKPEDEPGLLVYAPLLEGTRYPYKFFNWVTQRSFVTQYLRYITAGTGSAQGPLVCPYYYVYNYSGKNCVREILATPQPLLGYVMKGATVENIDAFTVAPDVHFKESGYRYFSAISDEVLKFNWKMHLPASPSKDDLLIEKVIAK